jgi:hypothetical protein
VGTPEVANEWTCRPEAYQRIISAVGNKYVGDVNRDRLVFDLQDAWSKWLLFTSLDSDKGARARKKLFQEIVDSAVPFKERLLGDRSDQYFQDRLLDPGAMYAAISIFVDIRAFDAFVTELDRVIGAAKELEQNNRGGWVRLERPPKEWLTAEILPRVFKRNFDRYAKVSRDPKSGKVGGPFIRFAVAVMAEWGIPICEDVVARALKDVRAGRSRRKSRPTTLPRPQGW